MGVGRESELKSLKIREVLLETDTGYSMTTMEVVKEEWERGS